MAVEHRDTTGGSAPTSITGLSAGEAAARLARDGPNILPVASPPPAWRHLLAQLVHFFALLLWVAGLLAFVAGMPQLGAAIFAVIVINGLFAFVQEQRAEHAAARLRDLLPRRVPVIRDGQPREIDARDLVVGDLALLVAGDRISADLALLEAHALQIDTATLTGESVTHRPAVGDPLHAGTFVVEGEGRAVVTAIGGATRLAGIARLTRAGHRPPSPLARELDRVVRAIAGIALGVGVAFFAIALLVGSPPGDGFLFAIGVTVALVPEGLLPTITLSLALGAQRMATQHALVRRLEAVETLGSTTFICTDKTGTLTRNEMAVVALWTPQGDADLGGSGYDPTLPLSLPATLRPAAYDLALAAARSSTGKAVLRDGQWVAHGDPMEAAFDVLARRLGLDVDADMRGAPVLRRFPFDPRRRRMSVVAGDRLLVKGAPDTLLSRCTDGDAAQHVAQRFAARGLRVLAVASRAARDLAPDADADTVERDLTLLGLVGLQDPPRPDVAAALAACRSAGINVAMITGDGPETARAIAREVGLLGPDGLVVEGHDLPRDEALLGALVDRDGIVISRVAPEDKQRIALALQARGHIVAMTGDGVNDGPALQLADIGIAMGRSGTDVAREAADLVLLDDNFATIVAAIEQGRATYANIRRFLTYHLTDNVAELTPFVIWALSGGRFPLAIGVLQVLALDIGTDLLPALALGGEPPGRQILRRPPLGRHLFDRRMLTRVFAILGPVEALAEMAAFVGVLVASGWRVGQAFPGGAVLASASGAAFAAVVIGQMANAFACRSTSRPPWVLGWATNRLLLGAVAAEVLLLLVFIAFRPLASVLGQAAPPLLGWILALLAAPAILAADAAHKWFLSRRGRA